MFLSTEAISLRIINSPAPLFFIDTCVFLDILRSVYRENVHVDAISSTLNLINLSQNTPPKVWLMTNQTVYREWNENISGVKLELEREIKKSEKMRSKLITSADITLGTTHPHGQSIVSLNLHEYLRNLSNNFLTHCLILKEEFEHHAKGSYRSTNYMAPAKRGKAESKDCLIFEAFLDISEKLRNLGYCNDIYFLTSNSEDYGNLNSPLVSNDLEKINATLINNLPLALTLAEGRTL